MLTTFLPRVHRRIFTHRITREFCGTFDELQVLFIHVPKAAGSSIALSLFGHQVTHASILDYYRIDFEKTKRYFKFAFVRDPLKRAYSAYRYLRAGGMNAADREFARKHIRDLEFDEFIQVLAKRPEILDWLHFRPQYKFIYDGRHPKNILVNFVGHVENMETDLACLERRIGRPIEWKQLNRSPGTSAPSTEFDPETKLLVAEIYADDYEAFGYNIADR